MKKIKLIAAMAALLALIPASSFALFDIGAYGGYSYKSTIDTQTVSGSTPDPKGLSYGLIGHYNQPIFPLITMGVGLYSQYSKFSYSYKNLANKSTEVQYGKKIIGIDLYLELNVPLLPIHPYVKFASGIYEDMNGDLQKADRQYFNTYSTGGGLALTFFPFLQVFVEYRYDYIKQTGVEVSQTSTGKSNLQQEKATGNTVFIGLRANL